MHRKIIAIFTAVMLLLPLRCFAQDDSQLQLSEQKIKAGLVYNFLKYTEWPAGKMTSPSSPLVVCVFGAQDPFGGSLRPIEERTVQQRSVKLRYISTIEESARCNMLFVGRNAAAQWPALHSFLIGKSVLTVGDFDGFTRDGGMIGFNTADNRIQIWLNNEAVGAARLHIHDSLRRLAKLTHPSATGGTP